MGKNSAFENYLTTASFTEPRDTATTYRFYENDYGPFLPKDKDAAILDIGCGMGEFITFLKSRGYGRVSGADASSEMVDFCKGRGLTDVVLVDDTARYLSGNAGRFDLITLNDTLEHLPKNDTVAILRAVKMALKKDGVLLVRTLNFSTIGGMYIRYKDFTHEIAYTEYSLKQVLRLAGFEDIRISGNKYFMTRRMRSVLRFVLLKAWFFILKAIYTIEIGEDRPKIFSKILVAACRNS